MSETADGGGYAANGKRSDEPCRIVGGHNAALHRECPRCYNEISDPRDVACDVCGADLPPVPADALNEWRQRRQAAENEAHWRADLANYGTVL